MLVLIGAAAWCSKCQRLRPAFEQLSGQLPGHVLPLWLDLEDHAEFLDGFIAPDLPLLLRWRQGTCVQAAVVIEIAPEAVPSEQVKLQPLVLDGSRLLDPHQGEWIELPPLWKEFVSESWAAGG
ncbi:hypothetical protein [Roseateles amylovorans]|uniref:Thioredoxin n=1 Tax=Roseateles amylovorans TaxID=2978473 RepID=A0ABY6B5J3_9BURK|nr:hypothetical protein [Roseateles amylovorans]UXH80628.1 hypothetical protein N4261_12430 [Roseateles amylovorans]